MSACGVLGISLSGSPATCPQMPSLMCWDPLNFIFFGVTSWFPKSWGKHHQLEQECWRRRFSWNFNILLRLFSSFSLILAEKHALNSRQCFWDLALSQSQGLASCGLLASQDPSQYAHVLPSCSECWHRPREGLKGQHSVFIYFQNQIDTRY